jgi:predicted ATPase/DNA-binding SARP family transcriptional activator
VFADRGNRLADGVRELAGLSRVSVLRTSSGCASDAKARQMSHARRVQPTSRIGEPPEAAPAAQVCLCLLGGFSVAIDAGPVGDRWRLRKAKTLVKLLALEPSHRLHRDVVVEQLWPESTSSAATNNLHQAVHAARSVLGPSRIVLRDDVLQLCPDDALIVDVEEFESSAAAARAGGDADAVRRALELWSGRLLPEDAYDAWCVPRRERLDETYAALVALRAAQLVDEGRPEAALDLVAPLADERRLDEALHRTLMTALGALGRRWEAIEEYERLRDALEQEYGAQPESSTRALYRRLLSGGGPLPLAMAHNLPEPSTSFVGRRRELAELLNGLDRGRLLTLTGPGGAGKSRLALELGRRVAAMASPPDGVWLVELAGVREDDLVGSAVASVLGLSLPDNVPAASAVSDQLATRALLLVLDNCEHLLDGSSRLVAELLARCPDVALVTTSREPLAVAGEVVYRVPSLGVPGETNGELDVAALSGLGAVQLFVERARQIAPQFVVDESTAVAVAEICRQLDGMPLALELAAARLAHLSVDEVAARVSSALTLLVRRGGARLDRQQTLAATLDWSHELLEPAERVAFRRLAVFAGGFDLDAAAHVFGDPDPAVDLISRLVDKSLVEADTSGAAARYRLLEVVRQYAEVQLGLGGDEAEVRRRHREWFAAAAAERDPDRGVPVALEPSAWFDVEQDNLRAALSSALTDQPDLALRLAAATWRFWLSRGLIAEGARWLGLALAGSTERSAVRARALTAISVLRTRQGRSAGLLTLADDVVGLRAEQGDAAERAQAGHERAILGFMAGEWALGDEASAASLSDATPYPLVLASARHLAGVRALGRADLTGADELFDAAEEALAEAAPDGTPYFQTLTLAWVVDDRTGPPLPAGEETLLLGRRVGAEQAAGHLAVARALTDRLAGRVNSALARLDGALEAFVAVGDRYGEAYASAQRGHTLRWVGEYPDADRSLAASEALRRELRDQRSVAMAMSGRALVAAATGDGETARTRGHEALQMMVRTGDVPGTVLTSSNLAVAEVLLGDPVAALSSLREAVAQPDLPGGHRAYGWLRLLQAHLLRDLGDRTAARTAAADAHDVLFAMGEKRGTAAAQSGFKVGVPRLRGDDPT